MPGIGGMTIDVKIRRGVEISATPRVQQMLGIFDVPPSKRSEQSWHHRFELPEAWNIGVIVGPSGAGKTTLAKEAFGKELVSGWDWPAERSILDGFPKSMGIRDISGLLSSVGFSSPPSWVRPFHVLSNGEQFRVNMARTLAEMPDLAVVDEFTSVVDRTVAQIGSAAIGKAVRRRGQKFVAVTCHYDVLDWLEPDWVYEPHTGKFEAADAARGAVRRRPAIDVEIVRVHRSAWELFKRHHYLDTNVSKSAACFVGLVQGNPAAFSAVMSFPHPIAPAWREHRTVCLPDYQGVGIGNAMSEFVASIFAADKRYTSVTSHPSMIRHRAASQNWRMVRKPSMLTGGGNTNTIDPKSQGRSKTKTSIGRLTAGFEYVGPVNAKAAAEFGLRLAPQPRTAPASRAPRTARPPAGRSAPRPMRSGMAGSTPRPSLPRAFGGTRSG